MKIAIFTDSFLEITGGIPSSIESQRLGLEKLGHEVVIFCPGYKDSVAKLPKNSRRNIIITPTFNRLIRPGGAPWSHMPPRVDKWVKKHYPDFQSFDLIHVQHESGTSVAGVRLAKEFKIPLVQTMHGREDMAIAVNVPHPFKNFMGTLLNLLHSRYIPHEISVQRDDYLAPTIVRARMWTLMVNHASCADLVLTPSLHFGKKIKHYGLKKPHRQLSNSISDHLIPEKCQARELAPNEPLKMIWNSRLSREKRIIPFLGALAQFNSDFRLYVFGNGNDERRARRFVKKNHLEDKVIFKGVAKREDIVKCMEKCHLEVMTSYGFDVQPMTLLEAESVGLPVFICDPDMKEVVPEGSYVLAKSPAVEDLTKSLEFVRNNPEKIRKMSEVMIKHRFEISQSACAKNLEKIYKEVLEKKHEKD